MGGSNCLSRLVTFVLLNFSCSFVYATATFDASAEATLTVTSISVIDSGFFISISDAEPVEMEVIESSGGGTATANVSTELNADDADDIQPGEGLRALATASGSTAAPLVASADALANALIGLDMVNDTDQSVTVVLTLEYTLSALLGIDDPLLENGLSIAGTGFGTGVASDSTEPNSTIPDPVGFVIDDTGPLVSDLIDYTFVIAAEEIVSVGLGAFAIGEVSERAPPTNEVPAPGTLPLLALGLATIVRVRQKLIKTG